MNTHLTEDQLVLHYYGEMADVDERLAAGHLSGCSECHTAFTRLQRVLAVVVPGAVEDPGEVARGVVADAPAVGLREGERLLVAQRRRDQREAGALLVSQVLVQPGGEGVDQIQQRQPDVGARQVVERPAVRTGLDALRAQRVYSG